MWVDLHYETSYAEEYNVSLPAPAAYATFRFYSISSPYAGTPNGWMIRSIELYA